MSSRREALKFSGVISLLLIPSVIAALNYKVLSENENENEILATQVIGLAQQLTQSSDQSATQQYINVQSELIQDQAVATYNAHEMLPHRIKATADAFNIDEVSLTSELISYPQELLANAVRIKIEYSPKDQIGENGIVLPSGLITHFNATTGEVIIITAGHAFGPFLANSNLNKISLNQPHKADVKDKWVESMDLVVTTFYPEYDLAIIKTTLTSNELKNQQFSLLNDVTVVSNWSGDIGERLFSISFPHVSTSDNGLGFFPSKFDLVNMTTFEGQDVIIGNSLTFSGSSGGAVCTENGEVVGIIIAVGPIGTYILPLKDKYQPLLKAAGFVQ